MSKVKIISNIVGVCPYCNSTNTEYHSLKVEDDHIYYPATCDKCGRYFEEWYYLKFVGHNVGASGEYEAYYVLDEEIEYKEKSNAELM